LRLAEERFRQILAESGFKPLRRFMPSKFF
jgi:hypothetical protein